MVSRNMGHHWRVNNTKSKEELGIDYTPPKKSINDFIGQMAEHHVKMVEYCI
jgi:dihydroflavonol-4-reductase